MLHCVVVAVVVMFDWRKLSRKHAHSIHRSHNQQKGTHSTDRGRRKCFSFLSFFIFRWLLRSATRRDRSKMQCNKFTLISHKFKLCIFCGQAEKDNRSPASRPGLACPGPGLAWVWANTRAHFHANELEAAGPEWVPLSTI